MDERALRWVLLGAIGVAGLAFAGVFVAGLRRRANAGVDRVHPSSTELATGFVTVFFDTLGIGSFATTTAIFRAMRMVPDELIPGTLNVGHTIESVLSAFVFINLVPVAPVTLIFMVVASALGAWFGSGVVAQLPRQRIRYGMGVALTVAATVMLMSQLRLLPSGGNAMGLSSGWLVFAIACNFVLGSLMTLGIGLYAPCMIVVCLLGMNPKAAFPIMMGSCAGLMPMAAVRFVHADRYSPSAALGLTLGGIPALFIAAYLVKSLPLDAIRWLVIVVVFYTAATLTRAALQDRGLQDPTRLRASRYGEGGGEGFKDPT
jgi:uncharacterized membrane protein YfcA